MKKLLSKLIKSVFAVALVAMTFCALSCASSTGGANDVNGSGGGKKPSESGKIDVNNLVGSWFWNYGYDQKQFCNEQLTLNSDGTMSIIYIAANESEWDTGTYSLINDEEHGPTLLINLMQVKEKYEDDWEDVDVKIYYEIETLNSDHLLMKRYKRDLSAMDMGLQLFDPGVVNDYHKIKDGTKENLVGKWTVNKRGTPGIDWDETWIFNEDGTMEDYWTYAGEEPVKYKGTYEVIKEKTGSILHTTLSSEQKGSGTFELNPPMEFWIDYKTCGENLIKVRSLRNMIGGEKHDSERDSDDFYYRDIPLETVTYHWDNYTFKDYYPVGTEYELLDLDKPYLFSGVHEALYNQKIIGWYDNPQFSGNPIEKISKNDSSTPHEFWAKWAIKVRKSVWDESKGKDGYGYRSPLPLSVLFKNIPDGMKIPSKGEKRIIVLSANVSKDFEGWGGIELFDASEGWQRWVGKDWHPLKSVNGKFVDLFEIELTDDLKTENLTQIGLNLGYNPDTLDDVTILTDFKFEILEPNSPRLIEHTFNYGNFIFKQKSVIGYDFYLPQNPDDLPSLTKQEQDHFWHQQGNEFIGWYDNPEFKGNPVKSISGADNTKGKTFYGKYNLKFYQPEAREDGNYYSNRWILAKTVTPNTQIDPKKGDVVMVVVSGTLSQEYEGPMGLDLYNFSFEDAFLANDWHYVETKNKKFATCFELKMKKDANYKSIDEAAFLLAVDSLNAPVQLVLSDFKFELVEKDPFVTTEAESKHVSIKPCAEGFEITVRKLDSEKGDWTYAEIWAEEDGHQTVAGFDLSILNKNKSITFVWPFCEKGKTYNFRFAWTDSNGQYNNQPLSVIASNGKGELNFDALKKIKVTLESNSKEANLCAANFKKENLLELVKNYQESITYVGVQFPVISGSNDWSDTQWLFAVYCGLFPEFDSNNSFFAELFSKGKANILGDFNFDWGDKEKINDELSKRSIFCTDLRIHFKMNSCPDAVGFYTISNRTDNVPYTPVKF